MGNKASRRIVTDGEKTKSSSTKRQQPETNQEVDKKLTSNGAAETGDKLDVKVYRSTSSTEDISRRCVVEPRPDIKLYRRSCAAILQNQNAAGNAQTLPRSFRHSAVTSPAARPEVSRAGMRQRQSVSEYGKTGTWNKASNRRSVTSMALQVEFPSTDIIKCRLAKFEQTFCSRFTKLYASLAPTIQLSALSIAVHRNSSATDHSSPLSLWQYVHANNVVGHHDMDLAPEDFALTITAQQLADIQQCVRDSRDVLPLAHSIVAGLATDAAAELTRVFEYQLVLLGDGIPARLVAELAADIAIEYLKSSSRHLDFNAILQGITGQQQQQQQATVSVIIGQFELKWNIIDIFLRPGLRREKLLIAGNVNTVGGYGTPWTFHASPETDATIYGYRGQIILRDYLAGSAFYHLDTEEQRTFGMDVPWRADDFHQTYRPYQRLVGSDVMAQYAALTSGSCSLGQYVQRLHGEAYSLAEIQPIYRPLAAPRANTQSTPPNTMSRVQNGCSPPTQTSPCYLDTPRSYGMSSFLPVTQSTPASNVHLPANDSDNFFPPLTQFPPVSLVNTTSFPAPASSPLHTPPTVQSTFQRADQHRWSMPYAQSTPLSVTQSASHASSVNRDVTRRRSSTSGPPPPVKPKPSLAAHSRSTTTPPVCQTAVNSPPMTLYDDESAVVRFPTIAELFNKELKAMKQTIDRQSISESEIDCNMNMNMYSVSTQQQQQQQLDDTSNALSPSEQQGHVTDDITDTPDDVIVGHKTMIVSNI